MFWHVFALFLSLSGGLTSTLFASTERGDRLLSEAGGAQGVAGVAGPAGAPGLAGAAGAQGIPGIPGIPGAPGILDFSDFYTLAGSITPTAGGAPYPFEADGSTTGVINRLGPTTFNLPTIGTYLVQFQASLTPASGSINQMELELNGVPIASSLVQSTGTIQVIGISYVTTTSPNSVLSVINPLAIAETYTPNAGSAGVNAVSAHLTIIRVQ
jgi:hypothetical protein